MKNFNAIALAVLLVVAGYLVGINQVSIESFDAGYDAGMDEVKVVTIEAGDDPFDYVD